MNLVVLAEDVDSIALKNVAKLTGASEIQQITPRSFRLVGARDHAELAATCSAGGLDHAWLPEGRRLADFGLFVTDMDSTLINIECIDEIADMQGLKAEVAAITEAAMQGEIDFRESLTRRVALLGGLPERALEDVLHPASAAQSGRGAAHAGTPGARVSAACWCPAASPTSPSA